MPCRRATGWTPGWPLTVVRSYRAAPLPSTFGMPDGNEPPVIWFEPTSARSTSRPFGVSNPFTPAVEPAPALTLTFTPWEVYSFAMRSISATGTPVISAYSSSV